MKTYVVHVSSAHLRKKILLDELTDKQLDTTFVIEGDKTDLTPELINTYFKELMNNVSGATSCAYKHLLIAQKIADGDDQYALVLEDDIFFYDNFNQQLSKIVEEIEHRNLTNFIISIEDSILKYVERSQRKQNQHLYKKAKGRLAGAYIMDQKAARAILQKVAEEKMGIPIDWFHNLCESDGLLNIYWAQPTICCQRSHNGTMPSLIDKKEYNWWKRIKFLIHKKYKEILYTLR